MRLELGNIFVDNIKFGQVSKFEAGTIHVNEEELKGYILEDENIKSVALDIARPGDSVRIIPVKDVIEPRVKVTGGGEIFPGMLSKVETVGGGRTNVLKGSAVVTTGKIVGFQEGIIDMTGPGAEYTPFSKLNNLVVICEPAEGLDQHAHEKAVRLAGLKAAAYIGRLAGEIEPDEIETFETPTVVEGVRNYPDLPRVAYVQMLQTQGLLHDTYVYGVDMKQSITTMLSPTETMDGAIVSGNCVSACDKNTTFHQMNNPIIADLFAQHGKELNFIGMIITNENVYLADKERSSDWTAKLVEFLGADGVIISQEGFGNPDTDLIMNCKKIEAKGIKTVIITDEYAGRDGASQSLADADISANAVVTGGNANMLITLPPMERTIGHLESADIIAGGFDGSLKPDGSIEVELQVITGSTNELGYNKLSAR